MVPMQNLVHATGAVAEKIGRDIRKAKVIECGGYFRRPRGEARSLPNNSLLQW